MFQMVLLLLKKNILRSMNKCRSYGPDKLNLWPFYYLIFKCDLDLQPLWTNISTGTSAHQGEYLCQIKIILKSMPKCRSFSLDKLNLWLICHLTFVTLTFKLPEQIFQMAFLLLKDNNCAKLFWNPCINVEVMALTNPYRWTHACTHMHRTKVVTTMSHSPQAPRQEERYLI